MAMPLKDLTGQQFGYLTVLRREGTAKNKVSKWACMCVCGNEVVRLSTSLRNANRGGKKSCGCRRGEMLVEARGSHGMTGTRPWVIWQDMRRRCRDPKSPDYPRYGGRGVDMPESWYTSFAAFWEDVRDGYSDELSLDRRDNALGYSRDNCRWVTTSQQLRNTSVNVHLDTPWGRVTVAEAAERAGLRYGTLHARIRRHGPDAPGLLAPPKKRSRFTT